MMRTRAACAVMVALGGLGAVGCIPPATGGGTPKTTTTTTPGNPAAACYDSGIGDLRYSGTPNVVGNLVEYTSTDGSCTGDIADSDGILVLAEGDPQANAECFALGRASAFSPEVVGLDLSDTAWICTHT